MSEAAAAPAPPGATLGAKAGPWVDLALTLPIFLGYHMGVVFLDVRNAADVVTGLLMQLAEGNKWMYLLIVAAIGVVMTGVFAALGRGQAFRTGKFVQIMVEGAVYAVVMGLLTTHIVGTLFAGPVKIGGFVGVVMSFGAGFYEELAFRVLLFGLGAKLLVWLVAKQKLALIGKSEGLLTVRAFVAMAAWGAVCATAFSGIHYIGAYGDPFKLSSFTFRFILGMLLTLIYATRGFAAAVWTHALYDVWVLVFR
jgi:hypothetical protein